MHPPPSEPAPSAQDLAVATSHASATMWTSVRTGVWSSAGSEAGSLVGRPSSDVDNVLAGISFRSSSKTHVSVGDSVEGKSSGSNSRRKRGDHDEREQRMREATTLQLSELLSGFGRVNPQVMMPPTVFASRSLTDVRSNQSADEQKATDADSEVHDPHATGSGYHPWWETVETSNISASHVNNFHSLRTCNSSGLVGLLVDPGAHDNLAGETTMRRLEHQLEVRAVMKKLNQPLSFSGVGKSSQQADRALSVDFQLSNTENGTTRCSYTAPVIPNSELPPLLGLKSLQSKRAVLDTYGKLLILPGPGGLKSDALLDPKCCHWSQARADTCCLQCSHLPREIDLGPAVQPSLKVKDWISKFSAVLHVHHLLFVVSHHLPMGHITCQSRMSFSQVVEEYRVVCHTHLRSVQYQGGRR